MRTKRLCLVLILLFCLSALGEAGFDGSVYAAYAPVYDESALSGMEVITYIELSRRRERLKARQKPDLPL